ncbi:MAG: 50S ribosomal protein L23 [archaeon]
MRRPKELELHDVIEYPLISEKAVGLIESQNKVVFIVNKKATKTLVRNAVEKLYAVKVDSIQTIIDQKGRKKAIVKLNPKFRASDLATKLGVI